MFNLSECCLGGMMDNDLGWCVEAIQGGMYDVIDFTPG